MPLLFDAHNHLPVAGLAESGQCGVLCGTCEADWGSILAHAKTDARLLPMLGLHPWRVATASPEWAATLENLLRSHPAGVGECGLDFAIRDVDRSAQESAFRHQLRLAKKLNRPIAIHVARAWGRVLDLLRAEGVPAAGAMVHAFSGSPETLRQLEDMGVFLSFSGDLLKPDRRKIREAFLAVSSERLLLESDGSADLAVLCDAAAILRGMSTAQLARQTWENGQRCFKELLA